MAVREVVRIVRFRRQISQGILAPTWLVAEAERIAVRLHVRLPEILAVPGLGTPMVWCLCRPKLLLPAHLAKSVDLARWRGILAHELAHLRRGDQWVSRLELAAGLVWWWNPLYWLARRQLDAEAELACDACVVQVLPEDRLAYAEMLFQIGSDFSLAGSPAPVLGVAGSGRFFERRLRMILDDRTPGQRSFPALLVVCFLVLLAVPSWTSANSAAIILTDQKKETPTATAPSPDLAPTQIDDDEDDDGDDDDRDDADDDDDDQKENKSGKAPKHEKEHAKSQKAAKAKGEVDIDVDTDLKDIGKRVEETLGPDFEKKIEAWAERFAKQIEDKFGEGSDFAKKMEALGKEMEQKFGEGSDFAKKMEALGKEMEQKFGEDSEFAKKMEGLGKEMEQKFGPGSDFAKKMEQKFGEGSDFAKKMEALGKDIEKKTKDAQDLGAKSRKDTGAHRAADLKLKTKPAARKDRIQALEAKIQELMKELEELKEQKSDDGERDNQE
jgi:hypothetical protein